MKIKVNEKEFYSIDIPDEISSGDELIGLAERFKSIAVIFKKNIPSSKDKDDLPEQKRKYKSKPYSSKYYVFWKSVHKNRNNVVKLLQFYYHDSKENRKVLSDKLEIEWGVVQVRLWAIKNAHNITCDEVGLIRFPNKYETKIINELRDPNFVYNKNVLNELSSLCEGVKE